MLLNSIKWRKEFDLVTQLEAWQEDRSPEAEYLRSTWPCGVFGIDKRGCPVYYARNGGLDLNALEKRVGFDRILCQALTEQRQIEQGLDAASKLAGKQLVQVICVADFDGMSWWRAARSVPTFRKMSAVLDAHFPERLHVAFVARAPGIFAGIYKLAEAFLAADTKAKVRICGKGEDAAAALAQWVERSEIPDFLGGDAKCAIPDPNGA